MSDSLWERLKKRSARFRSADEHPDQTHVHHALVTVLLFGTLGAGLALMARAVSPLPFTPPVLEGLRWGIIGGWVFYAGREILNRLDVTQEIVGTVRGLRWVQIPIAWKFDWRWQPWDGICDVVIPLWVTAPIVFGSLWALWGLSLAVAALYFLFRPIRNGGGR